MLQENNGPMGNLTNFFKNNLKNILIDVNKNDRFHITVQGWTGTL